ncbi:type IV pilin [Haloplanus rallus]|uniref:Type IV pilin n=1 Tax=Haloplanus rallus TaxID=1816183 RepID=A0A6B9F5I4_9EURY|nr:type IV pilin [Haloplanus rallus]QGX93657.1 type IV pilin [Haloplanus rallus]
MNALRTEDRGVSNTVGVVLLVGMVVLLAATLWVLVSGLAGSLGPAPPQAAFDFEYETGVSDPNCAIDPCEVVRVVHTSGDTFDPEQVEVVVYYMDGGTEQRYATDWVDVVVDPVDAGERVRVWTNSPIDTLATARIELLWTSEDGQHSDVIARWEGPSA